MSWAAAEAAFATTLPGYESRAEQRRLAETIEKSLSNVEILMAQAGTGTGKSLAGMVPAIHYALEHGTTVVISTATKALQDQYATKDVPFLLGNLGVPFEAAVLKGRSNYACLQKISELGQDEVPFQDALIAELQDEDHPGDMDYISAPIDFKLRFKLTATSDECPGKNDCTFGDRCFAEKAKKRAKLAQIVIVNHAMLITDLKMREKVGRGLLPDFSAVLIDEAHELEEYATNALGSEFSERGLKTAAVEAANFLGTGAGTAEVAKLNGTAVKLFADMNKFVAKEKTRSLDEEALVEYQDSLINVLEAAKSLRAMVQGADVTGDDKKKQRRKRVARRLGSMAEKFEDILLAEAGDLVRWVERDDKRGVLLKFAPLHVGPFLKNNLWSYYDSAKGKSVPRAAVLLSATLAVGKDFSYIASRLGVGTYLGFDAGTPFDYPNQAALFVPDGFDPTTGGEWKMKVGATLTRLAEAAGGRALFLFTSTAAMKEAHAAVAPALEAADITVLMQGELPNKQLAQAFKDDETSVLFALKSFMTGFDVQGDSLRLVVLDKLPFAVPTDVIWAARAKVIDLAARGNFNRGSFKTMSVPAMALTLMQGFGRLIRTKDDEGLVAILDSRLHTKRSYGPTIINALPPAKRIRDLTKAAEYLADVTDRRS